MSPKQTSSSFGPGRLAAYDRMIATVPGVERKGASMPYQSGLRPKPTTRRSSGGG